MKKILLIILVLPVILMAQKPDSTLFKYHISELKEAQKRIAQLDTLKLKYIGIAEYHYAKILDEQRKFKPKEK